MSFKTTWHSHMEPSHDPSPQQEKHMKKKNKHLYKHETRCVQHRQGTCQHYCQSLQLGGLPGPGGPAGPREDCRPRGACRPHRRLIKKRWTHWWSETPAEGGASVQPLIGGTSQPGSQISKKNVLNTGVVMLRSGETGRNWRFDAPSCPTASECNTSTH